MEIVSSIGLAVLQLGEEPSVLAVTPFPSSGRVSQRVKEDIPEEGQDFFFFLMGKRIPSLMAKLCPQMPSVGL